MNRLREKTTATLLIAIFMISATILVIPAMAKKGDGVRIQDGTLTYSTGHFLAGQPLKVGYDIFGYNYQAHLYNGYYCNIYLGRAGAGFPPYEGDAEVYLAENPNAETHWTWPYRDVWVNMKWNDAWLSNMDRGTQDSSGAYTSDDPDGNLDRHYGYDSNSGSGAWETNHMRWEEDGEVYTSFTKFVAAPADAYISNGYWHTSEGVEIGEVIWGAFAILQDVFQGLQYLSPASAGFGYYKP